MITVDIRGFSEVQRALQDLAANQIPYATMLALNGTAFATRTAIQQEIKRVFDRPTPWLVNQVTVRKATKTDLAAIVGTLEGIKNQFGQNVGFSRASSGVYERILAPHIEGGQRMQKRSEQRLQRAGILPPGWIIVPGPGMPLDAYGNAKADELIMILSWLNALNWSSQGAMQNRAERISKRKNRAERRGDAYFAIGRTSEKALGSRYLRPGVYKRTGRGKVQAMLYFVSRYAYQIKLDWMGTANKTAQEVLPIETSRAVRKAIETAQ